MKKHTLILLIFALVALLVTAVSCSDSKTSGRLDASVDGQASQDWGTYDTGSVDAQPDTQPYTSWPNSAGGQRIDEGWRLP